MILVTAAYGNQGQRLIPLLARAGKKVRAMRASGDLAALTALGAAEAIHGDAGNPASLARAMEGVETVYHIGPALLPQEKEMGIAVVEAAEAAGVKHLVFSSVLHAIEDKLIQHRAKLAIEQRIIVSNIGWTILQPTNYMPAAYPVFRSGVFRLWWSVDRRQSLIVLDDYAEAAAKVICEGPEKHHGATYELCSGDWLTAHEIALRFARVIGRPVRAEEVEPDEFLLKYRKHPLIEAQLAAGKTVTAADFPYIFEVFRAIGACYGKYDFTGNPNVLTWLLGRKPTSVEDYVRREYARFLAEAA
ncbi:MAG: hypothetical protein BGN94_02035 [Rhizobiales bacterium 68-8]|nr:MAG: hypothetical protein BGN94_02035 [Rhizobiales bacterium 68-8]